MRMINPMRRLLLLTAYLGKQFPGGSGLSHDEMKLIINGGEHIDAPPQLNPFAITVREAKPHEQGEML